MSLRAQLLAFGLLTLVLPWAGLRFVREMEDALRSGLEASLLASASTVAAALENQPELSGWISSAGLSTGSNAAVIYAQPLRSDLSVDGFDDDWGLAVDSGSRLPGGHEFWTGTYGRYVYLYVAVEDQERIYQPSPGVTPYGDRLVLVLQPEVDVTELLLLTTGVPGLFRAQRTTAPLFMPSGNYEDRVLGAWRATPQGYSIEMRIPLSLVGSALGFAIIDVDSDGSSFHVETDATWGRDALKPGPFLYQRAELQELVVQFGRAGDRFRVLDRDGWVLSDVGAVDAVDIGRRTSSRSVAEDFFRSILRRDDPPYMRLENPIGRLGDASLSRALRGEASTTWYRRGPELDAIVAAAVPIRVQGDVNGAVLLEQASDSILTLTNQALLRLMSFTLLVSSVAAIGLLSYASLLSFRVRRLARAAENALGPKGEIDVVVPGRRARDEIGDLARSFADLLRRLSEYTEYLRTLSSKLSHELRTPLAIVSTSIDNLEQELDQGSAEKYLRRLRDGTQRLDSILVAMSEATRMEQAIDETATEEFEIGAVIESCCQAYTDVHADRTIAYSCEARPTSVRGSGELLAQMMDKLIDNAVSFSESGSHIDIELAEQPEGIVLSVSNQGPQLPESMREQLFDSLVSMRDVSDGPPHLGLGLYIVALITRFHGGRVEADNLADGNGVVFRVFLPRSPGAESR